MATSLTDIINANLKLIHSSKDQCLHKSNFIDEAGWRSGNSDSVIKRMLGENLIETEKNDDIYFLTEDGYEAVEEGWIGEEYQVQDDEKDDDYDPKSFSINHERPNYLVMSRSKFWLMLFVAAAAITAYNFYDPKETNSGPSLSPEIIKKFEIELDTALNKIKNK